jgi:hypothetical protein
VAAEQKSEVSWPTASGHTVLRESFAEGLRTAVTPSDGVHPRPAALEISRRCVQWTQAVLDGEIWILRVYVHGAAAVAFRTPMIGPSDGIRTHEVMSQLASAWRLAVEALESAGAEDEAFLSIHLTTTFRPPTGQWTMTHCRRSMSHGA